MSLACACGHFAHEVHRDLSVLKELNLSHPLTSQRVFFSSLQWAKVEGDVVTVGITDHAQAELGDVVYVELPEVGSTVSHKATFGVVESVKVRFYAR